MSHIVPREADHDRAAVLLGDERLQVFFYCSQIRIIVRRVNKNQVLLDPVLLKLHPSLGESPEERSLVTRKLLDSGLEKERKKERNKQTNNRLV